MIRKFIPVFFFMTLLGISIPSFAQLNTQAAKNLISRILPKQAHHFEVAYIPQEGNKDVYELESKNGKIILRGNNGVSVASALNYYLRYYCHCLITWNGMNLKLPKHLPVIEEKIHKASPYHERYYLNYCTFNYTMSWWDWDRWQKEIDWMALNGINMPLAITGQAAIWQKVYRELGFTDQQLKVFFSGPAYFSWLWMSNLDAWGGPLPQRWTDTHKALQKEIIARERSLGMTPVLPAFTGHVPPAFKKIFPSAKINKVKWGRNFPAVNILSPEDSLFTIIGKKFLKEQTKEYGTSHYYSADVFNEMTPPSSDSLYLNNISKKVYQSMHIVDTAAVWVMQGWLFHYEAKFWQPKQMKALLNAIPDDKMMILDLWSEWHPVWNHRDAYYGKHWIWNMLHNFGGRIYTEGCMQCVTHQPAELLNNPKAGKLTGLGLTMEATEQNPALYQLMLDNVWRNKPIHLNQWIKNYVMQRYGELNQNALYAWQLLQHSVYAQHPDGYGGPVSILTQRPAFTKPEFEDKNVFHYNPKDLLKAWKYLLAASDRLKKNDGFQFDLVDIGRQVLADYALTLEKNTAKAFRAKNLTAFQQMSKQYLSLIDDMDTLLGTRKGFLLSKWINNARSWGVTQQEKDLYEFNARDLITLWGGKDCTLHDYSRRQWNGLLKNFYKPRWKMFLNYADSCLINHTALDKSVFQKRVKKFEWNWVNQTGFPDHSPQGNPITISRKLYSKYFNRARKAWFAYK